jgi:hypothetical protein
MNKTLNLLLVITAICVSFASLSHIRLVREQLNEISFVREKRMKLNGYFRYEFSVINWQRHEKLAYNSSKNIGDDHLREWEERLKTEMGRYGYTTPEIETLQKNAEVFGAMICHAMHEEEYARELKAFEYSDDKINEILAEVRLASLNARAPFVLNW